MAWPAVQLPADVLSQIFRMLRNQEFRFYAIDPDDHESHWYYREHGFRARWIRTSWVCRSWRDAALHTRQLWTDFSTPLDVKHPEAIGTFLGRAPEGRPLRIYVEPEWRRKREFADQDSANALEHLLPWSHRIEFLWLFIRSGTQLGKANNLLGTLGPTLRTLAFGMGDKLLPLPLNIYGLRNLRTLYLKEWIPSGDTPLPDITCLIINEVYTARPLALQRFLATCTGLEHLYITNGVAPRLALYDPSELPVVDLPQLKRLTLRDDPPDAVAVALTAFRLPATATFELETETPSPSASRRQLRAHGWLRHALPHHLDNLDVFSGADALTVKADDVSDSGDASQLCIRLEGGVGEWDAEHFWFVKGVYTDGVSLMSRHRYFGRFVHGLPLIVQPTLLTRLELHFADWLPLRRVSLWREVFGRFHSLHELTIGGWEAIEAATRTLEDDLALLPELRVLRLCINDPPRYREGLAGGAMLRWLTARQEERTGLERLEATQGRDLSPEAIQVVTRIVLGAQAKCPSLATKISEASLCESCGWKHATQQRATGGGKTGKGKSNDWGWEASESSDEESEPEEDTSGEDNMVTSASETDEDGEAYEEYEEDEELEDSEEPGEGEEGEEDEVESNSEEGEADDESN